MKVNISCILKALSSSIEINDSINVQMISYNCEDIPVNSPVEVSAILTNVGDHLALEGSFKADLTLKCSRCLESFNYILESDFDEELSNNIDNKEAIYFEGDSLDLNHIIVSNVVLSLPMKFICRENCKGLCPNCGKNINFEDCNCKIESLDPRLAVLKNYLKDN